MFYQLWITLLVIQISAGASSEEFNEDNTTEYSSSTSATSMVILCDELVTTYNNQSIYWPKVEAGKYVHSWPVCLDELKFPKYRYYHSNCMEPESLQCTNLQPNNITSDCPNGELTVLLNNDHKICFSNSTKYASSWDYTQCLQSGSTLLDDLIEMKDYEGLLNSLSDFIQKNLGHKFWLPIRRDNTYSPLQYYVPYMWKRYINVEWIGGMGNCLTVQLIGDTKLVYLENCNNKYPMLCGYDAFDRRKIDCLNDTYVLYPYPNTAKYAYVENGLKCKFGQISVANSLETTKVYKSLLHDRQCAVNVFPYRDTNNDKPPVNITFYNSTAPCGNNCVLNITDWIERYTELDYINWNVENIGYGDKIVVDSTGGWTLANSPRCTICEDKIISSTIPTIVLESNQDHRLVLIISVEHVTTPENVKNDTFDNLCNFKKLLGINCFAQYDNMKYENFHLTELAERNFNTYTSENILTAIDIIGISYNEVYSIQVNESGRFWCEGYSIFHNLVISSDDLYVAVTNKTDNFAVIVKVNEFQFNLNQEQLQYLSYSLMEIINSELIEVTDSLSSVQLKKVITLDFAKYELIVLVHFEMARDNDDDDDDDDYFKVLVQYKKWLWQAMATHNETKYTFFSINHTQFCLPEVSIVNGSPLTWGSGQMNEYVTTENFAIEENGLPIVRQCIGDTLYGVQWSIVNENNGGSVMVGGETTKELFNLERTVRTQSNESLEVLKNISSVMTLNINQLIPADLFTISKVLSYLDTYNFTLYNRTQNLHGLSDIATIIDSCTLVNVSVIQKSQEINATNTILYSFDMAISNIGGALKSKDTSLLVKSPNVLVVVLNPGINNISGIAVYKNLTKIVLNNDLSDYYVDYIMSNASITSFNEGFTIASFVPRNVLENLLAINDKLQIIITVLCNDNLYQDETHADQIDSIVISVTLPGISSRLPGFIPFYFTSRSKSIYSLASNSSINQNNYCSYWNFQPKNKTLKSEWSQDGCHFMGLLATTMNTSQISACACDHLTSFAFLVGDMEVIKMSDSLTSKPTPHDYALDLITLLGCSMSILGALGIFVTALVFPVWRRKSGILLQFSGAIAFQMGLTLCVTTNLFDFKVTPDMKLTLCIFVGAAIQYSVLVVFSWTLISAYLQFKRYVSVFNSRPANLCLKTFVVGWLMPLLPVVLGVFISPDSYRKSVKKSFNVCYPMHYALYFTVLLPIALIILANLMIFIIVVRNVFRMTSNKYHAKEKDLILSQMRLSVFLFFLLGLSWFFGLANSFGLGLVFSYLFCLTATVQGLVLFVYFVLMDPETRSLWRNLLLSKSCFGIHF